MIHFTYRTATPDDIDFLLKLRRVSMGPHLLACGFELSNELFMQRILFAFDSARIILHEGQPIGLLKTRILNETYEFLQMQLLPAYQGLGIGGRILSECIQEAEQQSLKMRLTVLLSNPARRLYKRYGFSIVGQENSHYLMERPLKD